jgi:hypothetical protein|tara:strand:+ start:2596 stop:2781 length:186 start_codon:yes stop_codon:yes gene_type:complete
MSDEQTVTSLDAINKAAEGDVTGFKDVVNDLLMDKIKDSVEIKKHEVSTNFMSQDNQEAED